MAYEGLIMGLHVTAVGIRRKSEDSQGKLQHVSGGKSGIKRTVSEYRILYDEHGMVNEIWLLALPDCGTSLDM